MLKLSSELKSDINKKYQNSDMEDFDVQEDYDEKISEIV